MVSRRISRVVGVIAKPVIEKVLLFSGESKPMVSKRENISCLEYLSLDILYNNVPRLIF